MFSIDNIIRPNIKSMKPYSSARDEFSGREGVFLDANENPYETGYNRYPDPLQREVKSKLAELKGTQPESIFLGNGSDEAIDLPMRAFCEPGVDNVVAIHPSYGMYEVAANINNVEYRKVLLKPDYSLDIPAIKKALDSHTKLLILCSPNNPTGNDFPIDEMLGLAKDFSGILMVDEAYIDFTSRESLIKYLPQYPNLMVLQTFSKAWAMAGLRLGVAYASKEIIAVLNKIKYPYNVNVHTQKMALEQLTNREILERQTNEIIEERNKLSKEIEPLGYVEAVYPSSANFILVKMKDARKKYEYLISKSIILRDRSKVTLCDDCIRITVGKPEENRVLLTELKGIDS